MHLLILGERLFITPTATFLNRKWEIGNGNKTIFISTTYQMLWFHFLPFLLSKDGPSKNWEEQKNEKLIKNLNTWYFICKPFVRCDWFRQRRKRRTNLQRSSARGHIFRHVYCYNSFFHDEHIRRFRHCYISNRRRTRIRKLRIR